MLVFGIGERVKLSGSKNVANSYIIRCCKYILDGFICYFYIVYIYILVCNELILLSLDLFTGLLHETAK